MYFHRQNCIVGLLQIFNEFSEFNGSSSYRKWIFGLEEILFHIEMMIENFSYAQADYFVAALNRLIDMYNPTTYIHDAIIKKRVDHTNHFLVWNNNPVKIWVIIVYLLKKLSKRYIDLKTIETSQMYWKLASIIIDNCENIRDVELLLTDFWINGYEVIDLICYENIEDLLANHSVGLIIADFWSGPFYRQSFLTSSAWYQIIASNILKPQAFYKYLPNKVEEITNWIREWHIVNENHFSNKLWNQETHIFRFEVWKKSMDVIYIVDGIIIITLAIYFQYVFFGMIDDSFAFQDAYAQFLSVSTQLQDTTLSSSLLSRLYAQFTIVESDLISKCEIMQATYDTFLNQSQILVMYFVKNLLQILFLILRRKRIQIFTAESVINFIWSFVWIYLIWIWKFYIQSLIGPYPKYRWAYSSLKAFDNPYLKVVFWVGIIIGSQWWRVFFIFKASRVFGPLIEILLHMLKELLKFLAIYGLIFMVFLSAGAWMYFNYSEFKSENWRGVIYLFAASLGSFDFSLFGHNETFINKEYGWVYLMLFLVLTNIVLINFLIAILSNKYTEMETKKKHLYNQSILMLKQVQTDDKYYSWLVASFVPLNVLMIPFVPFIIFWKSEKLNRILMYACYAPMIIFGVVLFVAANLALLPFAYIVAVYSSFVNLIRIFKISKLTMKLILIEIGWLVIVIFLTVPFLIMQTVFDSAIFVITLFNENTKSKQDCGKTRSQSISIYPEVFDILMNFVELSEEKIDVKEIILYFRERFRLVDQISAILLNLNQIEISGMITELITFKPFVQYSPLSSPLIKLEKSRSSTKFDENLNKIFIWIITKI